MEHEEWKDIYEIFYKPMLLYALSLTKNMHDAEDLIQETFIKAFLSYERTENLKYWLVTVLKHEYYNLYRKRKREILSEEILIIEDKQEDDLDKLIRNEERRLLFQEIQKLPIREKEILMESIYFHLSDSEIARMHKISNDNVRKIRSRAKQKLMKRLEGES